MQLLIALLLALSCLCSHPTTINNHFIVFTHDGTFYKLDPQTKQVQWHKQLPFKLLSFDLLAPVQQINQNKRYFIPTIDGDFLYLEHSLYDKSTKQILVPRQDVEHLLDICFDSTTKQQKYFVYQKFEYFVLNTQNGQFHQLQNYFQSKLIFNKNVHIILIVGKKLLKQLNSKLEVKWSVISSRINLVNVEEFINKKLGQVYGHDSKYSFVRNDAKTIQIQDQKKNVVFQIQASSSIMVIFGENQQKHMFTKIGIKNSEVKMLALGQSATNKSNKPLSHQIMNMLQDQTGQFDDFPHSITTPQNKQPQNNIQTCLRVHKILKQFSENENPLRLITPKLKLPDSSSNYSPKISPQQIQFYYTSTFNPQDLPTLPYSSDKRIHVIVTKQQPFVYIFIIIIIIGGAIIFYKLKVNKLWQQITQMQNSNDENLKKIVAKLGQYQNVGKELKKMYEIYWNKIIYRKKQYFIFQGRFLNQNAQVFMIPLNGYDIIDIQEKLNILINCSHKSISKLYYYTRNQDSLLIFCQSSAIFRRFGQVNQLDTQICQKLAKSQDIYKRYIKDLMETIYQLMKQKIQIQAFSHQSLLFSDNLDFKLNIFFSFLLKNNQEQDKKLKDMGTSRLRVDIIKAIHKMGHNGAQFDLLQFEKQKNSQNEQNSFLKDFYDHFLLTQHSPVDLQALKSAQKHPFLWDSKQKMLYVCDFSNYIETCIDQQKLAKMQIHCKNFQIIPLPWNLSLHPSLAKELNNYRKYDFNSTRDLIRLMRNKLSHFHEIPKETRLYVGKTPQQFVDYFLQKFPKLLSFMYAYATKKKWKLNTQ